MVLYLDVHIAGRCPHQLCRSAEIERPAVRPDFHRDRYDQHGHRGCRMDFCVQVHVRGPGNYPLPFCVAVPHAANGSTFNAGLALIGHAAFELLDPGLLRLDDLGEHRDDVHRAEASPVDRPLESAGSRSHPTLRGPIGLSICCAFIGCQLRCLVVLTTAWAWAAA